MNEFKLIVAGGRDFEDYDLLSLVLYSLADHALADKDISIISGKAKGADELAMIFAKEHGILCHTYPADWDMHGNKAGYIRNKQMGEFSDGLLAFWDGQSKGTHHMIKTMEDQNKWVHVVNY